MMGLVNNARALDLQGWLRGLISAGISGAASSISGAIVLPSLDSNDFNVFELKYYIAIFALGMTSAILEVAKFLTVKPLPEYKEVMQMTQTVTTGTGDGKTKTIETTKETRLEPIDKVEKDA